MIRFTVYGRPRPAGSKRPVQVGPKNGPKRTIIIDANEHSREWKNKVKRVARASYWDGKLTGPLRVRMTFYFARPKSHERKNGELRAGKSFHHTHAPDVLKLGRAVEDALTGIVWEDDAQIVEEFLSKSYGESDRVEVEIEELALNLFPSSAQTPATK